MGTALKASTDIRFMMLVAAVLASSVVAFGSLYFASPGAGPVNIALDQCLADVQEATAYAPPDDAAIHGPALMRLCMRPLLREQALWVGAGILAELLVAVLLYLLHPWWLSRRRRMRPIASGADAELLDELADMSRQAGLRRPPRWLVAPYSTTHGGQAFGLAGRRRICLDVGLLVRYDLDRAGFRAVLRHELAHLRNGDVDRTYLSIATWWAFVAVAVVPFVAVSLKPDLFRAREDLDTAHPVAEVLLPFVALGVLTAVVYLARNAILRARELHADITAAGWDTPGGALGRVLNALPWPPVRTGRIGLGGMWTELLARLGSHPSPTRRALAVADPRGTLRPGLAETAGYGVVLGLALYNVTLTVGGLVEEYLVIALALMSLGVGVLLLHLLARAVLRTGTVEAAGTRRRLLLPAVAALGFALSGPFSLTYAENYDLGETGLLRMIGWPVTATILVVGLFVFTAWVRSVDTVLVEPTGRSGGHRWRRRVGTATAITVGAPLFAIWYATAYGGNSLQSLQWHSTPQAGWGIDWYVQLTSWTSIVYSYYPRVLVQFTPLATAGLVLLWAVPALLLGWFRRVGLRPPGVQRAFRIGAVAGLGVIAVGLALPFAAHAALPADVRYLPADFNVEELTGSELLHFSMVYGNTYVTVAALLQAMGAAVVAARSTRLRPVLVPLAVTTTLAVATLGFYLSRGISDCLQLTGPGGRACELPSFLPDSYITFHLAWIATSGVLLAVPAALFAAAAGGLWRRRTNTSGINGGVAPIPTPTRDADATPRSTRGVLAAGLAGLALLVLGGAAAEVPGNYAFWEPDPVPIGTNPVPPPERVAAAGDPCLVGTWREVSREFDLELAGRTHRIITTGITQTFRPDGVVVVDYGNETRFTTAIDDQRIDIIWSGHVDARYEVQDGVIRYDAERSHESSKTVLVNGEVRAGLDSGPWSADRYNCTTDTLVETPTDAGTWYRIELRRS
ncbi:M48 family metalloprotease [Micromonospora sp. NIE79]|uniref:M48 family metalloprotease n=1 Tax=Micromonospora trifolii TaxID=2911208 RepID=A0ABS9N8C5_9ACTN|nr:M48 family metalloprotease [Micromonospora trifolii]MCG5446201.1 M48 family metalloprotease [Micromonospora trifolii]